MILASALGWGLLAVLVVLAVYVVRRSMRVDHRLKLGLAGLSVLALVLLAATDWPSESMNRFWADHSVLSAVLTTLLLFGAGFLVYDIESERRQEMLDDSVTATGLGGLVEMLADIDFALTALLTEAQIKVRLDRSGKPLRWVRCWREEIEPDVGADPSFPWRAVSSTPCDKAGEVGWCRTAETVVVECLRRLSGGVRDWAPLLTRTRDGNECLVRVTRLRLPLVELEQLPADAAGWDRVDRIWDEVRAECRVLARGFEIASGARNPRWYAVRIPDGLHDDLVRTVTEDALNSFADDGSEEVSRAQARRACLAFSLSTVSAPQR